MPEHCMPLNDLIFFLTLLLPSLLSLYRTVRQWFVLSFISFVYLEINSMNFTFSTLETVIDRVVLDEGLLHNISVS